jgi:hypothetical protein
MSDAADAVARLRAQWSLDFTRVRLLLTRLAEPATVGDLVASSGLPRRDVEALVEELSPYLETDGPGLAAAASATGAAVGDAALTGRMAELAAGLPPSRWRLDHVPATPETMARRARYLSAEYELDGASVLCLGDHDLTSLAVGSVAPGAELTVVDIDEPVLDHVAGSASGLGFQVTAAWADLRLALPPSLVGTADLVFTDPPYTPEGMRLFLARALEALRSTGHERLAFCFGTGARHLVKALEIQSILGDLGLALEAMLPGFNRYDGAEAIGARSDLYICRPTTGAKVGDAARPARSRRSGRSKGRTEARIYTRGPAAREAPARTLPEAVLTAALTAAGEGSLLLVGDGWDDPGVGLAEFFRRAATWATAARPGPFPFPGLPVVNTHPDHGGATLRTLLLVAPERAVLVGPRRHVVAAGLLPAPEPDPLVRLVAVAYNVAAVPTGPGGDPAVVVATRHDRAPGDAAEAVLRHIVLHPGAKVANAWRDGLLAVARDAGTDMTRNEARARIDAARPDPALRRLRTWELPLAALRALVSETARSMPPPP